MEHLSDIAVFVQVVESGSFTTAAERLGISKSVVSKYVTRLEDRLGVRLLNRTTRRLSLTEAGEAFFSRSRRGLHELEAAEAEVSRLQEAPRGTLKLNVPMTFGIRHIAPAITDFLASYPEVSIEMNLEDRQIDLVEEGFDLAVRIAKLPDSSLVARQLCRCRHVVCATPEYLAQHDVPRTPEDLRRHNALIYRYHDTPNEWRFAAPDGRQVSVAVNGSILMNNSLALREALLQGAGIALAPTFLVGQDIQTGKLQTVLNDYGVREISVYALYPERRHLSPKVRAFVDFMAERFIDPPYWDALN